MKKLLRICLFFPAILFFSRIFSQVAPVPYPVRNALYLQDFNSLPVTGSFSLPPKDGITLSAAPVNAVTAAGWQACMLSGSGSSAVFTTGTGSATTSAAYSFGTSGNTDRSLGTLASGTGIYAIGVLFTNQTGITLNSITVSFTAQQWRKGGSGNRNSWQCNYKTGIFTDILQQGLTRIPQLDFYSVHTTTGALTLNGRLQENQLSVSFTLTGITWKNGEQLLLRWDDTDEAGSDDAMAMDQFSFSADKVISPPLIDTVFVTDTIQDQAKITMRIHPNNAKTNIILFYDTLADFRTVKNVIPAGSPLSEDSGTTYLNAVISGLRPACRYFMRVAAGNIAGTVASPVNSFTIPVPLPVVSTLAPVVVSEQSVIAAGILVNEGGAPLSEKGFVWSLTASPLMTGNKVADNGTSSSFTQQLDGLPSGTLIYLRAFATNSAGTAYGNTVSFYTKTLVSSLVTGNSKTTTEDSATFTLTLLQPAGTMEPGHFSLLADDKLSGYSIKSVRRSGTTYTITVITGTGAGTLRLVLQNDNNLVPGIQNIPYTATSNLYVDKSPPLIRSVSIRDRAMRVGDTVTVSISTDPDTDIFRLSAGTINNIQLASFSKLNDSSYTAVMAILNGGKDLAAEDDIPVRVILKDAAGNSSTPYTTSIKQPNDPVDANKPFVVIWEIPGNGVYKSNDTFNIALRFSEAVYVDSAGGLPSVQVTIGSRVRNCIYSEGSGSDRIWFSYPVQAGETARDGIRIHTPFLSNGSVITDLAGNSGVLSIPGAGIQNNIRIDAAAPAPSGVTVPAESTYGKGSLVYFTVQFTKDVFVDTSTGKPFLLFTAGAFTRQAFYTGGSGTSILRFSYEVQQNDLAKKGLSLSTTLQLNGSVIRDSIGNAAIPVLKNIPALSKVYFDGTGPVFRNVSPQQVKICADTRTVALSDYLETTDAESELLTWRVINFPLYGQLAGFDAAKMSLPNSITSPLSVYYLPAANGNTDLFSITVSDGVNNDTLRFIVIPTPAIRQQHAPAAQTICSGSRPQQLELAAPSDTGKIFTYQWESTTDTTKGFAIVAGTGNTLYYTPPALKTNTWFRRKNIAGHCTGNSDPVLIKTMSTGLWLGHHSNDWHNTANWCGNTLPADSTDVLVQAGTIYPPFINAFAACNQLHIAANASLFIQNDLAVYGAVTGAGAINAVKGGLLFHGNAHQSVPSGMLVNGGLKKLVVNNKTHVSLPSALTITGSVTMQTGDLFTNNNLTMAEDAIVEAGAQNAYIRGNVNILQQLRDVENSSLLLGHPFTKPVDPEVSYLFPDTAKHGYPASLSQYYSSLFRYDDSTGYLPFNHPASWIPLIGNWGQQQVIRIYPSALRSGTDSFFQKTNRVCLSMSGELNQGDQQVSLAANEYTGYRAVTNPYLCPIDVSCIGRSRGLAPYYWTWNPLLGSTGGYQCRLFDSPGLLAPSQVIFVKTDANTSNELLFTENCKISPATGFIQEDENYCIVLKLERDGILHDELRIYSIDSSKARRDRLDAEKIMNPANNIFSYSDDNHILAIDARPLDSTAIIPIGISTPEAGVFTLTVAEKKLPRQLQFYLHDKQTDTWMTLEKDNSYYFESGKADQQSQSKRFEIKAYPRGEKNTLPALSAFHIQVYPVPAREKIYIRFAASVPATTVIQLFNTAGHKVKQVTPGTQKEGSCVLPVNDLARGIYILQARSGTLLRTQKIILQ